MSEREPLRGLDPERVGEWILDHMPDTVGPISFDLIAGGHSNLTYAATDAAGKAMVVRRPPLGGASGGAHDMGREYTVIAAVGASSVPVPEALAMCDDAEVNGAPFYVMSRVSGHVVDNPEAAQRWLPGAAARHRAGEQIVDVLADLHRVDVDAIGLGDAARRDGFLDRQLGRYRKVWERNATRELPDIEAVADELVAKAPPQRYTGIVHSDYRLGNVMVDDTGTLVAVLDWELWTLGDVLADVGFLLNNWYEPDDDIPLIWMEVPPTVAGGFGTRADALARYADRTGFDVSTIPYYRAFQYWKVAVLAEGVKRRYETAQMANADVDFAHLNQRVLDLVRLAGEQLGEI